MKKILFLLVACLALTFSSCKKTRYERRLDGSWTVSKYTENGVDKTGDFKTALPNYTISFSKSSHTFTETVSYSIFTVTVAGNFSLSGDNQQLVLANTSPNNDVRHFNIIKIASKELVMEESSNTAKRYYLVPK